MCDDCLHLREQLAKLHDDLLGATETMNAQGKELSRLRRELTLEQATSPTAMQVQRALQVWAEGQPGDPNIGPHGARARLVRQAIALGHTNPSLPCPVHDEHGKRKRGVPKESQCTVVDEIIEAFEGLKLIPFVGPNGGRVSEGTAGAKRYDDVKYALTDRKNGMVSEAQIEHMRGYARRARMWPSQRLWEAYKATSSVSEAWLRMAVDANNREYFEIQQTQTKSEVIDLASRRVAAA